ncbi:hypothetical protein [Tenacibaculum maritimum]|uniref:hypothetical protein n=1 Tax=Tenacibaculum maritimum TaxID=107401 RepID=UPI0012E41795|nr:hypothetical protein [Tenacibaculum maritimum]MCD9581479.1 hypothetical protein [Tenacibaculum maritimum]MCD9635907.1 hypothetical protein [Tenacibaculum maritimum]CAA0171170.1 Protein of unknown function precursor [Tenacibaculum maritimum]
MKKHILFVLLFVGQFIIAQDKPSIKKDTIKTEVINVVTSYAPKVTDAFKIKKKPAIKHSKNTERKALEYTMFSVPVASTFIPKSGTMKTIDLGEKEHLYNNYFSLGLGNKTTPLLEAYVRRKTYYDDEFGVYAKFLLSINPVENSKLSSSFYNTKLNLFYKRKERYFDWKAGLNINRNKYNWYGLPNNINFTEGTLEAIEEEQTYKSYKVFGEVVFEDSYIQEGNLSIAHFSDVLDSSEFDVDFKAKLAFPLDRIHRNLNDLSLNVSVNFLGGNFAYSYRDLQPIAYSFFTLGVNPHYRFLAEDFDIKIGAKGYFSVDTHNNESIFLVYPDVEVAYPVIKDYANLYIGASGDLHSNTYKEFANTNPFVSPTLTILQTNEAYHFFGGFRGKLSQDVNYNTKISYKKEEDKPFFLANNSKSNGIRTGSNTGFLFYGYEYGNSFKVAYDNITTVSFFGEIEYNVFKNLILGANGQFNNFSLTKELAPWNLPEIEGELFAKYKTKKWYANANILFASGRKGAFYEDVFPYVPAPIALEDYIDVNLSGGYYFSDSFSAFIKVNNALNSNYQRYTNFNVQGFQALAGITWNFDF